MSYDAKFLSICKIPPTITLPTTSFFKLYSIVDNKLYLSGHGPSWGNDFTHNLGKVGHDLTIEQGIEASRVCVLNLMQTTRQAIKTLDNVESIIEVFGMVNCIDSFKEHSKVLNGASEILNFIFGQNGIHTRVAMGTNSLPFNFSVEIKMIIQIKDNNGI
jgi:enamine deaminase RidA (YjgF/YER057c/UK114 family)